MILIKNGYIKTMAGPDIENGQVLIDNGKIKEVGQKINVDEKNVRVIDAEGCLVTPGLIDGHCHIGMWEEGIGAEGSDGNEKCDPITPHMRAIDGINPMCPAFAEALEGGVTTVLTGPGSANVIGGQFVAMKLYGKRVDDMILKDPVAMKIALGENPKTVYGGMKKAPFTRMGIAALLRDTLKKAKDYCDAVDKADGDPDKMPKYDMKMEAMLPVMRREIPLKAHAHRADDTFTAIRIAKEFGLDITLEHCTEGHLIADELAKEGKPALVGPALIGRSKYEVRFATFDTPKVLAEAGVKIGIITDSNVVPLHYLPLCAGLAVKAGLDEEYAWKAITINTAEITGIADRVGSLEKGKDADIVIFKGSPLRDIQYRTMVTLVDGEIVYKDKNFNI